MQSDPRNPSLAEVIRMGIDQILANIHTALPGRIESYDQSTGLAKVKPLLKRKYATDSAATELPVISGVPVVFPRTANAWVRIPVAAGDTVLLVFAERSIDLWLEKGGTVDPEKPERFSLNDAIAIPGLFPSQEAISPNGAATSLEVACGSAYMEITSTGQVKINASKVTVTSPDVNLGDESGDALVKVSDLVNNVLLITAPNGLCTVTNPTGLAGTRKVKGA